LACNNVHATGAGRRTILSLMDWGDQNNGDSALAVDLTIQRSIRRWTAMPAMSSKS
jgi:hypothetical protein